MKKKSNQRITKIKIDQILKLLERAEDIPVEDATVINPATDQLTTYPDMDNLRIWTRDNLTKGLDKIIFNKFDSDGQTYMTTLVDGLPLYTKMSKTLTTKKYTDSYTFSDQVTISNSTSIDPLTGIISYPQSNSNLYIPTPRSIESNATFTIVFKLTSFSSSSSITMFSMGYLGAGGSYTPISSSTIDNTGKIYIAFDSHTALTTSGIQLNTWYTLTFKTDSNYNITIDLLSEDGTKLIDNQSYGYTLAENNTTLYIGYNNSNYLQVDATKCSFGNESNKVLLYKTTPVESEINVETSKPGLWLSNLVQPVSGSTAGSWLRSNLINSNESSYNLTNSDTIGNYSNTFTQPALINEKYLDYGCDILQYPKKGQFDIWVFYNQHFSPSSQSSISYVNIPSNRAYAGRELPDNYFEYKYGSYQSIAFPKDPDVQTYIESDDSCLEYTFYNSNSKSTFIMKAPNSKQTPQSIGSLSFKPNGQGSGNNYGNGSNPDVPNGSSGGCVSGVLTWITTIDGVQKHVEKEFSSCFKSSQAAMNPDSPAEGEDLGNQRYGVANVFFAEGKAFDRRSGEYTRKFPTGANTRVYFTDLESSKSSCKSSSYSSCNSNCGGSCLYIPKPEQTKNIYSTYPATREYSSDNYTYDTNRYMYTFYNGIDHETIKTGKGYAKLDTSIYGCGCGWASDIHGFATMHVASADDITPQENVDVWFGITNEKLMYEEMGIPWEFPEDVSPYSFIWTTQPNEDPYTTWYNVADKSMINFNGDFAQLEAKEL